MEGFLIAQAERVPTRFLGARFRADDGRTPAYKGPYHDLYQTLGSTSKTYFVNSDCTGGQTTNIPGVPPLEDRFVIVDDGLEVRTVVVAPLTTIATANLRKK